MSYLQTRRDGAERGSDDLLDLWPLVLPDTGERCHHSPAELGKGLVRLVVVWSVSTEIEPNLGSPVHGSRGDDEPGGRESGAPHASDVA